MQRRQVTQAIAAFGSAVTLPPTSVLSQPDKTLKILLGFRAGGSSDVLARLLAEGLKDELRQNVSVDNKPGAGGRLAAELFKNVPPEGSTVMITRWSCPYWPRWCLANLTMTPNRSWPHACWVWAWRWPVAAQRTCRKHWTTTPRAGPRWSRHLALRPTEISFAP